MSLEHRIVLFHHVIDLVCHHRGQLVIILDVIPIDWQMDAAHVDGALVICCRGPAAAFPASAGNKRAGRSIRKRDSALALFPERTPAWPDRGRNGYTPPIHLPFWEEVTATERRTSLPL